MTSNYQAYSPSLEQSCNHMHHSIASARRCAEHMGWEDAIIKGVSQPNFKKKPKKQSTALADFNTDAVYEVHIKMSVRTDDESVLGNLVEKWIKTFSGSRHFVNCEVMGVRRKIE